MADPRVSILKRDGDQSAQYSTYAEARAASVSGDLIIIWTDLNERIGLMNGVDILINDGVTIKSNTSSPTIYEFSGAVNCNIYGNGIIKNEISSKCILIENINTELRIECNSVIGTNPTHATSIAIEIKKSKKFHLTCSEVISDVLGFFIGSSATDGTIEDLNLKIEKIETGISNNNVASSSLITFAYGFISIEEIKCNELGHCFSHRGGNVIAKIKKMSTTNHFSPIATFHMSQGTGNQKTTLYFDEIICDQAGAVEIYQGTANLIGRRIYSTTGYAISYGGIQTNGVFFRCSEIISNSFYAINASDFNSNCFIEADYIEGNYDGTGFSSVIYTTGSNTLLPILTIKNAKIKNKNTSSSAKGIFLENVYPEITLINVKIISGDDENNIIYLSNGTSADVYNYGIFGNEEIDPDSIILKIGTWILPEKDYNYQCIIDPLLS